MDILYSFVARVREGELTQTDMHNIFAVFMLLIFLFVGGGMILWSNSLNFTKPTDTIEHS